MTLVLSPMEATAAGRICVIGPGRHSPVLGAVTEHVMASLDGDWEVCSVQTAVPGDEHDSTLIGMPTPALVHVPSVMISPTQTTLVQARALHRFLVRERPDVLLFELWSTDQADMLAVVVRAARRLGVPVVARCGGRLDESARRGATARLVDALQQCDLVITCGYMPRTIATAECQWWSLPEWKTEERQADPDSAEILAFLPAVDDGELDVLLRAFAGLAESRAKRYELHALRYSEIDDPSLERAVQHAHHAERIHVWTHWLDDTELERRVQRAGLMVIFDAAQTSRALDAATFHGVPTLLIRGFAGVAVADTYCGATECECDPASILVGIERANLARKYRYPRPSDWQRGAQRLSQQLAAIIDDTSPLRRGSSTGSARRGQHLR